MPIVSAVEIDPFTDGRQSERALTVRQGLERHFHTMGWVTLSEVTLDNGRRADLVALSPKSDVWIVEIKSSVADMRADTKWEDYRDHCDRLFFATLMDVDEGVFPEEAGLMLADAYGADTVREAPAHPLKPAGRRRQTLVFARHAARRLTRLSAHAGVDPATLSQPHDGDDAQPMALFG